MEARSLAQEIATAYAEEGFRRQFVEEVADEVMDRVGREIEETMVRLLRLREDLSLVRAHLVAHGIEPVPQPEPAGRSPRLSLVAGPGG